jgi:hypothetical protein
VKGLDGNPAVHYVAHGSALFFECFQREMGTHLGSARQLPAVEEPGRYAAPATVFDVPMPRSHTNLNKVTCAACWRDIRRMADAALRRT